jgi:DNA-binding transcriptional MerR regulator/effector-binding domain-containing protein
MSAAMFDAGPAAGWTAGVDTRLSIGDFSRMTHLSIKALRHYHEVGVLAPAEVDRSSGYRFYTPDQVPVAQVVRRFRDLGMPIDQVRAVLSAPDLSARNEVVVAHLQRMESELSQMADTVASLRLLLSGPAVPLQVEYRSVAAFPALAICEAVRWDDAGPWTEEVLGVIYGLLADAGISPAGPPGSLYPSELFELELAEVTVFVPLEQTFPSSALAGTPRVSAVEIPGAELAVALHHGAFTDLDRTYGALGTVVADQAIGVEGPIREHYLVSALNTPEVAAHRTEVAWPVFRTA